MGRVNRQVIGLVGWAGMLCPATFAQTAPVSPATDPFIGTVEAMKRSVAALDCMIVNEGESKILKRAGSAFFTSSAGNFLTAAHVILDMQNDTRTCPTPAVTIPVDKWRPEARVESLVWFPFNASRCTIDRDSDLAACKLDQDSLVRSGLSTRIVPVKLEWSIPPDGTQVAATGFPMEARDPMTVRAAVSAYRIPWQSEKPIAELTLDRAAWPGYSGSPVYLSDGRVVGILISTGTDEAPGITIARPAMLVRELLAVDQKR